MQRDFEFTHTVEEDEMTTQEIVVVAEHGLGFGDGTISTKMQLERGELTEQGLRVAHEIITTEPQAFVQIGADITDDGCGDGRPALDTWMTDDEGNEIHYNKSYPRAKVFGGGLIVASSMWRAMVGGPLAHETVFGDRMFVAQQLHEHDIQYGGHSDEHAHGDTCGCGAIDKYPAMSRNIIAYRQQIEATLAVLYGDKYEQAHSAIERVFSVYENVNSAEHFFDDAAGATTMQLMNNDGAVIKKLGGSHQEDVIVLNDVAGTTFNQPAFDAMVKDRGVDEIVQAFVVDVWRGRMYADAMALIALEQGVSGTQEELAEVAYADFLIRTLAVAATLTGGDLPVYARMSEGQKNFALAV